MPDPTTIIYNPCQAFLEQRKKMRFDGFRPEYLDFQKGIRVGHLEPHQRITQILRPYLETRYGEKFVIDRYGRGVYWQWICFLPKSNRAAKPFSHHVNFGCSKFFVMIDRERRLFKCGVQVERGLSKTSASQSKYEVREDWDWHRLTARITSRSKLYQELRRLVGEGFHIYAGSWESATDYSRRNLPSAAELRRTLENCPGNEWTVMQLYYPMTPDHISQSTGHDLVEAILAAFEEVLPVMNHCMQIDLHRDL